ncbi:MAG: hypothetical protein BroJett011_07460 [Chloroflexota bacterium]|nr:MAG: hypothetical protein BroJett011_07460 [Chloroflexota bacterium]
MDQKLALLSSLHLLDKNRVQLSEYTMRHLRIILSQFTQEVMAEDEYQELIAVLQEESYISQHSHRTQLTLEGRALVQAIGERVIGQTLFARLKGMVDDYAKNPGKYIQAASDYLSQIHEVREEKVKAIDGAQIRIVGFLLQIRHKVSELFLHRFDLKPILRRTEEGVETEINHSSRKYMEAQKTPILAYREDDVLCVVGLSRIPDFTLFDQSFIPFSVKRIKRERVQGWNLLLASSFMDDKLTGLGYLRSRWPGRTFIKYREFSLEPTNVGILRESQGINLDYTELNDDCVLVWIETFTSPTKRLLDFIRESVSDITNEQAVLAQLGKLKLRIIPSGSEVELKRVLPDTDLTQAYVPEAKQPYTTYWENKRGLKLSQTVQPLVVVNLNGRDLHFPTEMVYIDKVSLERYLGVSQVRKPKPEAPPERFSKVRDLFKAISREGDPNRYYDIHLSVYTPTLKQLCDLGGFEAAVQIKQPILKFSEGKVSLDPLDIFEGDYSPVCGRKNISVTHLILPQAQTEAELNDFLSGLQRMFSRCRLGRLLRHKDLKIEGYDPAAGSQRLEDKIRSLAPIASENSLVIAVIPDGNNDYYYALKRLLPPRTQTGLQIVRLSTFKEIAADRFSGEKYLALQILIKSLKQGESIWNLNHTAGLSDQRTLFVGIGFSRNPWQKKVSKCAAVLHDAYGAKVSWKVFSTPDERTLTKAWFDTLLYRIKDMVEQERPSRLVFYRKGQMADIELEAVQASLEACDWLQSIKCSFVSVLDVGNFRFYLYDQAERRARNLPAGYGIIVNRREAFLSTSNYDDRDLGQGTVIPIRLRLEIGDDDILDLLKEYHDLTYLNWPAPGTTGKYPLVATIAEKFAELIRENISAESLIYLDF